MDYSNYYDKIEDFLKGRLSAEEQQAFEAEMQSDPGLAREVAIHRAIVKATADKDLNDLRASMQAYFQEKKSTPGAYDRRFSLKKWWWAILVAAAAGVAIWWGLSRPATPKPASQLPAVEDSVQTVPPPVPPDKQVVENKKEERETREENRYIALADAFYKKEPFDAPSARKGEAEDKTPLFLKNAFSEYEKENYPGAIEMVKKPDAGFEVPAQNLRAHALFHLKKFDQASREFEGLLYEDSGFFYEAQWYALLCYLAQLPETRPEFEALLNEISGDVDHPFRKIAMELGKSF